MGLERLARKLKDAPRMGYDQVKNMIPETKGYYVYAAWISGKRRCLYVGKSGNMKDRIVSQHYKGQRGGDQFSLYVYDAYIHSKRCRMRKNLTTNNINELTGKWIQENVKFQWIKANNAEEAKKLEGYLIESWNPILNSNR